MTTIDRRIGIDFGTSTTVLCFADQDGPEQTAPRFINLEPGGFRDRRLLETVIYEPPGGPVLFGSRAREAFARDERAGRAGPFHARFKMDLLDPAKRGEAERRMQQIFRYVRDRYVEIRAVPLGKTLRERTFISFPAQWPADLRQATLGAATMAGFGDDVVGMDEPTAAMKFFLHYDLDRFRALQRRGEPGKSIVVLLVDMGAGTSDFVLFTMRIDRERDSRLLSTWPKPGSTSLGGREIDALIETSVVGYLRDNLTAGAMAIESWSSEISMFKEFTVSPVLARNGIVEGEDLQPLDLARRYGALKPGAPPYRIDRAAFGALAGSHMETFIQLIHDAIADAKATGKIGGFEAVDLVLLTGGHSRWYFVDQILRGDPVAGLVLSEPGAAALSALQSLRTVDEPERLITQEEPQTVVAQGLVLDVDVQTLDIAAIPDASLFARISLTLPASRRQTVRARLAMIPGGAVPTCEVLVRLSALRPTHAACRVSGDIVISVETEAAVPLGPEASYAAEALIDPQEQDRFSFDLFFSMGPDRNGAVSYLGYVGFDPTASEDCVFWSRGREEPTQAEKIQLANRWLARRVAPDHVVTLD